MINIRTRLTYQFILSVSVILIFFSVGVYYFSRLYLDKRFYKRLQDRAVTTTTLLFDMQAPDTTVVRVIDVQKNEILLDEAISIYNANSRKIIFSTKTSDSKFHRSFIPYLDPKQQVVFRRSGEHQFLAIHLRHRGQNNWVMVSGVDTNGNEGLKDLRKILIVMALSGILLLAIAGWLFADGALSPMARIVAQVNAIFPGNIKNRVKHPNQKDEIGVLVSTFNRMLDRVEQAFLTQKMFIANVSHELKNPLTKIYTQIEIALMKRRDPEEYEGNLDSLKSDTKTLIQLTNTLLQLAQTVVSSESLKFIPIRMDEMLWEVRSQVQKWNEKYTVKLHFEDFPEDENTLIIEGNEASVKVALMNVVENACKFATDQTAVVQFLTVPGKIQIRVFNKGPKIPLEDLPYIFQPFYRSKATADARKGHGVGLAIVSHIMEVHKGGIKAESDDVGTTFLLEFPLKIKEPEKKDEKMKS